MSDYDAVGLGDCFRCDRTETHVTRVGEITNPFGEMPLYSCPACTEHLAAMHPQAHEDPVRSHVAAQLTAFPP